MKCITRLIVALALICGVGFGEAPAKAQTEELLYTFTGGADGFQPWGALAQDS